MRTRSRSSTTTRPKAGKVQEPIHPGEVLLHDFLSPMGLTQYRAAKGMGVPRRRINEIVLGVRDHGVRRATRNETSAAHHCDAVGEQ